MVGERGRTCLSRCSWMVSTVYLTITIACPSSRAPAETPAGAVPFLSLAFWISIMPPLLAQNPDLSLAS